MIIDLENREFEKNEVALFEEQYMQPFEQLNALLKTKKDIEEKEKKFKAQIEKAMDEYGIKSIDNKFLKITRVSGTEDKTTLDIDKFAEERPKTFAQLCDKFPKLVKGRKSYVTFKVKA